jgi:hypothetical protein
MIPLCVEFYGRPNHQGTRLLGQSAPAPPFETGQRGSEIGALLMQPPDGFCRSAARDRSSPIDTRGRRAARETRAERKYNVARQRPSHRPPDPAQGASRPRLMPCHSRQSTPDRDERWVRDNGSKDRSHGCGYQSFVSCSHRPAAEPGCER